MRKTDAMVFLVDDDAPMRESLKNLIRPVGKMTASLLLMSNTERLDGLSKR